MLADDFSNAIGGPVSGAIQISPEQQKAIADWQSGLRGDDIPRDFQGNVLPQYADQEGLPPNEFTGLPAPGLGDTFLPHITHQPDSGRAVIGGPVNLPGPIQPIQDLGNKIPTMMPVQGARPAQDRSPAAYGVQLPSVQNPDRRVDGIQAREVAMRSPRAPREPREDGNVRQSPWRGGFEQLPTPEAPAQAPAQAPVQAPAQAPAQATPPVPSQPKVRPQGFQMIDKVQQSFQKPEVQERLGQVLGDRLPQFNNDLQALFAPINERGNNSFIEMLRSMFTQRQGQG